MEENLPNSIWMRSFWKKSLEASLKLRPIHRPTHSLLFAVAVRLRNHAAEVCQSGRETNFIGSTITSTITTSITTTIIVVTILMWLFTSCKNCCLEKKGRPGDMLATVLKKGWLKVLIQNISLVFYRWYESYASRYACNNAENDFTIPISSFHKDRISLKESV